MKRCQLCDLPNRFGGEVCGTCDMTVVVGGEALLDEWLSLVEEDRMLWAWRYAGAPAVG